jgi:cation/acetate symporter
VAQARSSVGWTLIFIAILYTTAPAVGAMVRLNLIESIQTGPVGVATANVAIDRLPDWMNRWSKTGLLAWEDKNGDGRLQYYNDQNQRFAATAAGYGWKGNELTRIDHDILTLANPELAHLPAWIIALVVAGALAAALATAAALLLTIASAISHDLLKGLLLPGLSESRELLAGRIAMVPAALFAAYLALDPPGAAAEVVALAFGVAAATLFPTLMLGIFDKRANGPGAILGMLSGLLFTAGYIVWFKGWFYFPGTAMAADNPDNWVLGIAPEAIGALGAVINFAVAYLVSRLTAAPPGPIQELVEDIRVPKRAEAGVDARP